MGSQQHHELKSFPLIVLEYEVLSSASIRSHCRFPRIAFLGYHFGPTCTRRSIFINSSVYGRCPSHLQVFARNKSTSAQFINFTSRKTQDLLRGSPPTLSSVRLSFTAVGLKFHKSLFSLPSTRPHLFISRFTIRRAFPTRRPRSSVYFPIMSNTCILILGSGLVAPPCVEYLLRNEKNHITVGKYFPGYCSWSS